MAPRTAPLQLAEVPAAETQPIPTATVAPAAVRRITEDVETPVTAAEKLTVLRPVRTVLAETVAVVSGAAAPGAPEAWSGARSPAA